MARYSFQVRSLINGVWTGWDPVKSQESKYMALQSLPKKSDISGWFSKEYTSIEKIVIDWQVGFYWGCTDSASVRCEYRVVNTKDSSPVRL